MSELRRMLLANATEQASNGGGDLPTKLVFSDGPNEDNARIYEYLKSLRAEQTAIVNNIVCGGDNILVNTPNGGYYLYSDGRFEFVGGGGGAD
ncbi:MAG: hypothetical protein J6B41_07365 [Alistipes sp.]|nr:hypothetical protein [Alistipes sp.]